jgi:hypothetical protein
MAMPKTWTCTVFASFLYLGMALCSCLIVFRSKLKCFIPSLGVNFIPWIELMNSVSKLFFFTWQSSVPDCQC